MSNSDKYLFCRHCGTSFKIEELAKHESQCSEEAKSEKEPSVEKKVLQDGEDGGPKETQVITKYPEDGTKKIVTKRTEKDDDGTKNVVTEETENVDDEGVVENVVKTTHKTFDDARKTEVVNKTVTNQDDGTQEVRKITEYHEESPGRVQGRKTRIVHDSSNLSTENKDALQLLKDLAPDVHLSQVSCLHCNQYIPRDEYLEHAKECRSERQRKE